MMYLLHTIGILMAVFIAVYPRIFQFQDRRKKGFWNQLKLQGRIIFVVGILLSFLQSFLLYRNVVSEQEKQNLISDLKTELQTLKNESFEKRDFDRLYKSFDKFLGEFGGLHKSIHDYSTAEKLKDPKKSYSILADIADKELFIRETYNELQSEFNYFIENKSHQEEEFKDLKLLIIMYTEQFDKVFNPKTCCNMTKMIKNKEGNDFYETEDFENLLKTGKFLMHRMGEEVRKI